jgi:hypothetical protein
LFKKLGEPKWLPKEEENKSILTRTVARCLFSGESAEVDAAAEEEGGRLWHSEHDPPQRLEKGRQAILNTVSEMMRKY